MTGKGQGPDWYVRTYRVLRVVNVVMWSLAYVLALAIIVFGGD